MKRAGRIICYISGGVLFLLSILFIVIESRNLFSGDWLLFENRANGFFRYFFRFLLALFSLAVSLNTFFAIRRNSTQIHRLYFYFGVLSVFVASNVVSYFSSNYIDLLFRLVTAPYFVGAALLFSGFYYERKAANTAKEQ